VLFVTAIWMAGEMIGYLTGSPGALRPRAADAPAADLAEPAARSTRV
jgi:hypothetical protein